MRPPLKGAQPPPGFPYHSDVLIFNRRKTLPLIALISAMFVQLALLCPAASNASVRVHPTVFHGNTVPTGKYPFMVRLEDSSGTGFCSGSLVNPTHVVTAAHCLTAETFIDGMAKQWGKLKVRFANTSARTAVPAKRVSYWRNWSAFELGNDNRVGTEFPVRIDQADIAVVELSSAAPLDVAPVPMAGIGEDQRGSQLTIVGYGPSAFASGKLRQEAAEAQLQIAPAGTCSSPMGDGQFEPLDSREICMQSTVANPTAEACNGDSGGALLALEPTVALVGVTSWGTVDDNCRKATPVAGWTVFASVSSSANWLAQQTGTGVGGVSAPVDTSKPKAAQLRTSMTACKGLRPVKKCSLSLMRLRVLLADGDITTVHSRATVDLWMRTKDKSGTSDFNLGKYYIAVPLRSNVDAAEIPISAAVRSLLRKHSADRRLRFRVEIRSYNSRENGTSTVVTGSCSTTGPIRCAASHTSF